MDYGKILKKSLEIAYKYKFLWIFAIFLGGMPAFNYDFSNLIYYKSPQDIDYSMAMQLQSWLSKYAAVILAVVIVLAILAVILWIFSIVSQGAIIEGADKAYGNKPSNFRLSARVGFRNFWRLLGLGIVIGLFYLLIMAVLAVPIVISAVTGLVWLAIALGVLFFILFLLIVFATIFPFNFAFRYLILRELGIFKSISASFNLFKSNFVKILILALILFGLGLLWFIAYMIVSVIVFLILASIGVVIYLISKSTLPYSIGIGLLILMIISVILTAFYTTFNSTAWTIAFRELLTKKTNKI